MTDGPGGLQGGSTAKPPLVEFQGVHKRYGGVHALDGVDLALHAGETIGFVGKNGAGKSTLIKVLAGAVIPDQGRVLVEGRVASLHGPRDSIALGLSFVHQDLALGLAPNLSAAENIGLGLGYPRAFGPFCSRRRQEQHAEEILSRLGVRLDVRRMVSDLTVVQQRMVTIARALSQQAKVIVLDEPTTSLTPAEIDHLYEVVDRLHEDGVTVTYVSHRLAEVFRLSQRIVVMRDGKVVHDGRTEDLDEAGLIEKITGAAGESRSSLRSRGTFGKEVLRVEHLSSAGVVRDVSFSLRAGEVLGLAGLVGAGRTETVRAVFGADIASGGRIYIDGQEVRIGSPRDALRKRVVLLPEHRAAQGMIPGFAIRSNITLPTLDRHRNTRVEMLPVPSRSREKETAATYMARLQIKAHSDEQPVSALSGGNQQKVIVSKWLHHGADVFMFDEPTQGIDVLGKNEIYALMSELAAAGAGVIFISSEFAELEKVCDRVLVLREGALVAELAGDDISETEILARCFRTEFVAEGDPAMH